MEKQSEHSERIADEFENEQRVVTRLLDQIRGELDKQATLRAQQEATHRARETGLMERLGQTEEQVKLLSAQLQETRNELQKTLLELNERTHENKALQEQSKRVKEKLGRCIAELGIDLPPPRIKSQVREFTKAQADLGL